MKTMTRERVQQMKDKAVRFVEDVLEDDERADEIEDESLEEYAARKRITIINPTRRTAMQSNLTKAELQGRVEELEAENEELQERLNSINEIASSEYEDEEEDEEEEEDDE